MKRYKRLQKHKADGRKVDALDDEPVLNDYELVIVKAATTCETFSDISIYSEALGIPDKLSFLEIVVRVKNATN